MEHSCIITGATGYIGSHLAKYLLSKDWRVHVIARPGSNYFLLEDIDSQISIYEYAGDIHSLIDYFKKTGASVVFHLAAAVITNYLPGQVKDLIGGNVLFGTEILEAARHSSVQLFVNTGTYWQNYDSTDYNPVDLYAATKEAFEKIIKYYVEACGIRAVTLRLFDVYGEDDRRSKLLPLLRKIAGTHETMDVSPGGQYLNLVHISDVCEAYLKAYEWLQANPALRNEKYDVCADKEIQLKKLIPLFAEIIRTPIHVNLGGKNYKMREIMKPIKLQKRLPNWYPRVGIYEGLALFNKLGGGKI